jgi:hypothetical protein
MAVAYCDSIPESKPKTGWTFGALPSVSFDTDLGFQYGGIVNFYHFGDGSRYPAYDHSLYLEISRTTKGSGINRFFYDSDRLLRGIRVSADLSYITERALNFYGFNGYEVRYNPEWEDNEDPAYKSRVFYRHERKMWRFKVDFQGRLAGDHLKWWAGLSHYAFDIGPVDIERLNRNKEESEQLPDTAGLYQEYVEWGLIPADAAGGGRNFNLKLGLVYDSRGQIANPMRGIWTELGIRLAPSFIFNENYGHIRVALTHRQYFTLVPQRLSAAFRIGIQSTIAGTTPWYAQPNMITSFMNAFVSEGLGGAKSLRGILRNRIVGDGFVYGNAELRWKFMYGRLFKQHIYLALNTFLDAGRVIRRLEVDREKVPESVRVGYFDQDGDSLHPSCGAGLRLAMNDNFIVAVDYGRAFDRRDGIQGIYFGLNYLY